MSMVVLHPSTAPFVQQAARAFHEAGCLDKFYTAVRYDPNSAWQHALFKAGNLLGRDLRRQFARRTVSEIPPERVVAYPWRELVRLAANALDGGGRLTDFVWEWAEPGFDRRVAKQLRPSHTGVYGFEFSSLACFQRAHELGIRCIYDLPAPDPIFVQHILEQEYQAHPELRTSYRAHTTKREPRRTARRRAEWSQADLVVVASRFTRNSYASAGLDVTKVRIVPYGAPVPIPSDRLLQSTRTSRKPTFLWAGTFSVRKGAHHLLQAWRVGQFGQHARLRIFGAMSLPERVVHPLPPGVEVLGSVPRVELMEEYERADALIFPTLCDGFGMVVTEAWSRGLPVITTDRAGAADLLRSGENGILVPAGSVTALRECLDWAITHQDQLAAMREAARATAASWQWRDYRRSLVETVADDRRATNGNDHAA